MNPTLRRFRPAWASLQFAAFAGVLLHPPLLAPVAADIVPPVGKLLGEVCAQNLDLRAADVAGNAVDIVLPLRPFVAGVAGEGPEGHAALDSEAIGGGRVLTAAHADEVLGLGVPVHTTKLCWRPMGACGAGIRSDLN